MRARLNVELSFLKEQWDSNQLEWDRDTVDSLVEPYQASSYDAVLQRQGDLEGHQLDMDAGDEMVEAGNDAVDSDSDDGGADIASPPEVSGDMDEPEVELASPGGRMQDTALAVVQNVGPLQQTRIAELRSQCATLGQTVDLLEKGGQVVAAGKVRDELKKVTRSARLLAREDPRVAEHFRHGVIEEQRIASFEQSLADSLTRTVAKKREAGAELGDVQRRAAKARRTLEEREEAVMIQREFLRVTPQFLGQGEVREGGVDGRRRRHMVLERCSRVG